MMQSKILITGSAGFLGKSICKQLTECKISTLDFSGANYNLNLSLKVPELDESFDTVIHVAGKAHFYPKSQTEIDSFFLVNFQGTINLCTALSHRPPKSFIFISTVAVYGKDTGENITEDQQIAGNSPYALSKIKAEQYLTDWCKKYNVILTILRPALLAGQNPPGNLGAMIKGIKSGKYFRIGQGNSRKSILMVDDIARLIPLVENKGGIYNVCDDQHPSFRELDSLIARQLNKPEPKSIPFAVAKGLALIGDLLGNMAPINSSKLDKITKPLTFSNEKAKRELGWKPLNVLENLKIA